MGYCSASDVAGLCRSLLGGEERFSEDTDPTRNDVDSFISSGCSVLETELQGWGYSVPPAATTTVYQWLADLNRLYAAARAEMSRVTETVGMGERTRGQVFDDWFWRDLDRLKARDLTMAGLSRSTTGKVYVGGTSKAAKQAVEDDSDRVKPAFSRGMFDFPGTRTPRTTTAS